MRSTAALLAASVCLLPAGRCAAAPPPGEAEFARHVQPLVAKYCVSCHGPKKQSAEVRLDTFASAASLTKDRKTWEAVVRNLRSGDMPPPGRPRPPQGEIDACVAALESQLSTVDCRLNPDPGRVTMRRLNRYEYNNTVRDLCGVEFRPADDFPSDDVGYGFDNIGDVLALPPLLMEKYLAAAEKILNEAVGLKHHPAPTTARIPGNQLRPTPGTERQRIGERASVVLTDGEVWTGYTVDKEADYRVRVRAYGEQAGKDAVRMEVRVDGRPVKQFEVKAVEKSPEWFEAMTRIPVGRHKVGAAFLNDFHDPKAPAGKQDRNLVVLNVEMTGPLNLGGPYHPESHKRILVAQPADPKNAKAREAAARTVVEQFARRAYRRPVAADEVERLMGFYRAGDKAGADFEAAVKLPLTAVLVSPHFLFRVEIDPKPTDPKAVHAVTDFEFASRLSYFLWASMPDDELFNLAKKGVLRQPAVLEQQVKRMLKDARSNALVENFAVQWLQLRNLSTVAPDRDHFRQFNDELRRSMQRETELFFESVLREDRSVLDFLDADYTFVNGVLADLYDIKGVRGEAFQRVSLAGQPRGGLLTQASILTLTSNPTRTSPVKRGKYILDNILGTPPPPPPPDVPDLEEDGKSELKGSLRQRLEQHRANPACASCHQRMDPLGFAFENFDAVGAYRWKDGGQPIDPSGTLPSGQSFKTPQELRKILRGAKAGEFLRCLTEKLLTYGMGRGTEFYDRCAVDAVTKAVAADGYRFSRLILEVVKSEPFQKRRGQEQP